MFIYYLGKLLKVGAEFWAIISLLKGWISHVGCIGLEEGAFVCKEGSLELLRTKYQYSIEKPQKKYSMP
jgi:hypothetical protein